MPLSSVQLLGVVTSGGCSLVQLNPQRKCFAVLAVSPLCLMATGSKVE